MELSTSVGGRFNYLHPLKCFKWPIERSIIAADVAVYWVFMSSRYINVSLHS